MDMFSLKGKNAVVIGGAGGLGHAIAQGLAEAGARVAISGRNEQSLLNAASQIYAACGSHVQCYVADAADEDSVISLVERSVDAMKQVHILVNAQGFNKKFPAQDFDMDIFRQMMEINVTGFMLSCKHFGRHMMENHYGKIVNLSSVRGKIATKAPGHLAIQKAALPHLAHPARRLARPKRAQRHRGCPAAGGDLLPYADLPRDLFPPITAVQQKAEGRICAPPLACQKSLAEFAASAAKKVQ